VRRPAATVLVALVAGVVAAGVTGLVSAAEPDTSRSVVVRDGDGDVLADVPLTGERFAVGYRNSIYHSRAESRYRVRPDGRFRLVQVAADERAVIEEYYAIVGPRRASAGDRRIWVTAPERAAVFESLTIAATDLGRRTLHVPGHRPVRLWRLVGDDPIVALDVEESS
jgi:hypothetical protein